VKRGQGALSVALDEPVAEASLRLQVIDDPVDLESLVDEWRTLLDLAGNASIFLSPDWHLTWWQVFASPGDRLHVVTVRDDERLIGILPLYRDWRLGRGATLRLIGTGESEDDEVASEYGDVLVLADQATAVGDAMIVHLATFDDWRRVVLPCLLESAVIVAAARRHATLDWLEREAGLRYRVDLEQGEEGHLALIGKSRARRIARSRRAVERDGGLVAVSAKDGTSLDAAFRDLAELNHERQSALGRKSVFASARFRRFHHALGQRLYAQGALDIVRYRLGTRLIAALYCFDDASGRHYYQSGFAARDANRYMPLTVAHFSEMERARAAGHRWYDLMRGRPPCYKDDFGCETSPMLELVLYRTPLDRVLASRGRRARQFAKLRLVNLRR